MKKERPASVTSVDTVDKSSNTKHLSSINPANLSKSELDDLYFALAEQNIHLKKQVNSQDEQLRQMSTKLQRILAVTKTPGTGKDCGMSCCDTYKAIIENQREVITEIQEANEKLTERVKLLNMKLDSTKQFLRKSSVTSASSPPKPAHKPTPVQPNDVTAIYAPAKGPLRHKQPASPKLQRKVLKTASATAGSPPLHDCCKPGSGVTPVPTKSSKPDSTMPTSIAEEVEPESDVSPTLSTKETTQGDAKPNLGPPIMATEEWKKRIGNKMNILDKRVATKIPIEKSSDEDKYSDVIAELKQTIVSLQEELSKTHEEYSSRISRLEQEVAARASAGESQQRERDDEKELLRKRDEQLRQERRSTSELALKLSLARSKLAEMETRLKAGDITSELAIAIESYLPGEVSSDLPCDVECRCDKERWPTKVIQTARSKVKKTKNTVKSLIEEGRTTTVECACDTEPERLDKTCDTLTNTKTAVKSWLGEGLGTTTVECECGTEAGPTDEPCETLTKTKNPVKSLTKERHTTTVECACDTEPGRLDKACDTLTKSKKVKSWLGESLGTTTVECECGTEAGPSDEPCETLTKTKNPVKSLTKKEHTTTVECACDIEPGRLDTACDTLTNTKKAVKSWFGEGLVTATVECECSTEPAPFDETCETQAKTKNTVKSWFAGKMGCKTIVVCECGKYMDQAGFSRYRDPNMDSVQNNLEVSPILQPRRQSERSYVNSFQPLDQLPTKLSFKNEDLAQSWNPDQDSGFTEHCDDGQDVKAQLRRDLERRIMDLQAQLDRLKESASFKSHTTSRSPTANSNVLREPSHSEETFNVDLTDTEYPDSKKIDQRNSTTSRKDVRQDASPELPSPRSKDLNEANRQWTSYDLEEGTFDNKGSDRSKNHTPKTLSESHEGRRRRIASDVVFNKSETEPSISGRRDSSQSLSKDISSKKTDANITDIDTEKQTNTKPGRLSAETAVKELRSKNMVEIKTSLLSLRPTKRDLDIEDSDDDEKSRKNILSSEKLKSPNDRDVKARINSTLESIDSQADGTAKREKHIEEEPPGTSRASNELEFSPQPGFDNTSTPKTVDEKQTKALNQTREDAISSDYKPMGPLESNSSRECRCPRTPLKDVSVFRSCSGTLCFRTTEVPSENLQRCSCVPAGENICTPEGKLDDQPAESPTESKHPDVYAPLTSHSHQSPDTIRRRISLYPEVGVREISQSDQSSDQPKVGETSEIPESNIPSTPHHSHEINMFKRPLSTVKLDDDLVLLKPEAHRKYSSYRNIPDFTMPSGQIPSESNLSRMQSGYNFVRKPSDSNASRNLPLYLRRTVIDGNVEPNKLPRLRKPRQRLDETNNITHEQSEAKANSEIKTPTEEDTDREISSMTDLPSERDGWSPRSPGEEKPMTTTTSYTDSTSTPTLPTERDGAYSEGELPRDKAGKLMKFSGLPAKESGIGNHHAELRMTSSEKMEQTLQSIGDELALCMQLLIQSSRSQKLASGVPDSPPLPPRREGTALHRASPRTALGHVSPRCAFTLHIGTVVFSDEAVIASRDMSLVMTWQFHEQNASMTRMRAGRVVHFDFSTEYDVNLTGQFINYLKNDTMTINICEMNNHSEPFATCSLPLRDALLHINRRTDVSLPLLAGPRLLQTRAVTDALDRSDEVGVLDLWCMLRIDPKLLSAASNGSSGKSGSRARPNSGAAMAQIVEDDNTADIDIQPRSRVNYSGSDRNSGKQSATSLSAASLQAKAKFFRDSNKAFIYDPKYEQSSDKKVNQPGNRSAGTDGVADRNQVSFDDQSTPACVHDWDPSQASASGYLIDNVTVNIRSPSEMRTALEKAMNQPDASSYVRNYDTPSIRSGSSFRVSSRVKQRISLSPLKNIQDSMYDILDTGWKGIKQAENPPSLRSSDSNPYRDTQQRGAAPDKPRVDSDHVKLNQRYDDVGQRVGAKKNQKPEQDDDLIKITNNKNYIDNENPIPIPQLPITRTSGSDLDLGTKTLDITVQWLALNEECDMISNPAIQRLYVAYSFLGRSGAELETPNSLPKPMKGVDKCHYNFKKSFQLDENELPLLARMARLRMPSTGQPQARDCIVFTVVSEPTEDPLGLNNCEDVGYAYLYLGDLLAYSGGSDSYGEVVPVREAPAGGAGVCGVLAVRVDGLEVVRKCMMHFRSDAYIGQPDF